MGSGFSKSNLEIPDPASYWSLNEICKRYRGDGMNLLMFDTGITREFHPSFALGPVVYRKITHYPIANCDDLDGHGTFCAGIACGIETELLVKSVKCKLRGVAPSANLVIWKGYDYANKITFDTWLQQLEDMASNCDSVDVVVISSGYDEPNTRMYEAISMLDNNGVIVVCAAGNDGAKDGNNIKYPASYAQTICVGAHDRNGHPCGFSSVGGDRAIDFFALGEKLIGPKPVDETLDDSNDAKYLKVDYGTSFAAPAVGALICLLLQAVRNTCAHQYSAQLKRNEFMKKLLKRLSTDKRVISREQLKKFFDEGGPTYLGPVHFIEDMIASREI